MSAPARKIMCYLDDSDNEPVYKCAVLDTNDQLYGYKYVSKDVINDFLTRVGF